MQKSFLGSVIVLAGVAGLLIAQEAQQAPATTSSSPVAEQPKIQSKKEMEAIQKVMQAPDAPSRIAAVDALITGFPKSEWTGFGLQMATASYQMLNDYDNMMIYGERTLEADPDNFVVMLAMANGMAQKTREFDLDKEEKLSRATEFATKAIEVINTAPRPNPEITDAMWDEAKGDFRSQGYEALGLVALVQKDYAGAAKQFKAAIDATRTPSPATKVRLAVTYDRLGNYGEAIVLLDEVLADQNLHPSIRSAAEGERARAVQAQGAKAKQ